MRRLMSFLLRWAPPIHHGEITRLALDRLAEDRDLANRKAAEDRRVAIEQRLDDLGFEADLWQRKAVRAEH